MIGWIDATAGASGDMLLGALLGAGVPLGVLQDAVDALAPGEVRLAAEEVARGGLAAVHCRVAVAAAPHTHRRWREISATLDTAPLDDVVRERARAAFARLAAAEATVHRSPVDEVAFHEVGALDSIADVVGTCAGLTHLGLERLTVSTIAVGSGRVRGAHGSLPVPVPAVVELLRGVPTTSGPGSTESCTPTGAALLRTWSQGYGPQPPMVVEAVGVGAGGRDPSGHANVLRLLAGHPVPGGAGTGRVVLVETNVDDMDPRLWPSVLADLLSAGALDAWLTPILMKKGRPAHVLSALVPPDLLTAAAAVIFATTSAIGLRHTTWERDVLEREIRSVTVHGHPVRVKIARRDGRVLNAQPEYDDVEAVARASGRSPAGVLAAALAALPADWRSL